MAVRDSFLVCFLIVLPLVIAKFLEDNQTLEAVGIEDGNSVTLIVPNIRPHSDYTNGNLAEVGVSVFIIFTNLPTHLQAGPSHVNNRPLSIPSVHPTSADALSQFSSSQTPALPLDQLDSHSQVRAYFPFGFISSRAPFPVRIA